MNAGPLFVYGLSRSGRAAVGLARRLGRDVVCWDDAETVRTKWAAPDGCRLLDGGPSAAAAAGVTEAVVSPGIPPTAEGVQRLQADGVACLAEVEFAWRACTAPCIAVTGTNGKSTTVTMVRDMLVGAGRKAVLCGNIGVPFADVVARDDGPADVFVVEVSSYQLALTSTFRPRVMVYTNYAPDHLAWHGGEDAYVAAKAGIAGRLDATSSVVVPLTAGPLMAAVRRSATAPLVTLGVPGSGATVELDVGAGSLTAAGRTIALDGATADLPYMWRLVSCGLHGTAGVAVALGLPLEAVVTGLQAFRPLEHRLEEAGRVGHVRFINDSKATNVDATQYALQMCPGPLVLLLGGRHKGVSYRELLPHFGAKVKVVVALGEARPLIVEDLRGTVPLREASSFDEALDVALLEAGRLTLPSAGAAPTVLLSPACASFDMFTDFEARGRYFKDWVRRRSEAAR